MLFLFKSELAKAISVLVIVIVQLLSACGSKSGGSVDVSQISQNWECIQVSDGKEKGNVTHYQFDRNGHFRWTVFLPRMNGNMIVYGDYSLNENKITMDNLSIQLPAPFDEGGATRSVRMMKGSITKLNNDDLNFKYITLAPNLNINNDHPVEQKCTKT